MKKKIKTLKLARKREDLTQEEVAKKLGVTRMTVTYWESGVANPLLKNLKKVVESYNLSMEELMEYLEEREE